jgi:hypothetical protein
MRVEMKCDDAFEAMSAGLDGELGDAERPRLRHHLAGCDRCRARDVEMRAVHRQMRLLRVDARSVRPPERLRVRVERDCRPLLPRISPFAFGVALTGAGALGALLALAFRSPTPAGSAELAAPEPLDSRAGHRPRPPVRAANPGEANVLTARAEPLPPPPRPIEEAPAPGQPAMAVAAAQPAVAQPATAVATAQPAVPPVSAGTPPPTTATPRPAAAAGCVPPPAPLLVQLEAPPQPAGAGSPEVHASLTGCGLEPAVVKAIAGQNIQLQNTGPDLREIQVDQQAPAGAAYAEGGREQVAAGASVTRRFDRPGLYPVWCDGGAQPCGYLAVVAHPQFALVEQPAASGPQPVQIAGAPGEVAGNRAAVVYQFRRRARTAGLTLDANGNGQLRLDPIADPTPVASLALNDCRVVRDRLSPVAHACARGGIKEAKKAMKQLVKRAKDRGLKFECDSCHRNEDNWQLTDDARANFTSMLAATGT